MIGRIWGQRAVQSATGAPYQPSVEGDLVFAAIEALAPQNDVQRNLKFRALATTSAITESRVLLFEESDAGLPTDASRGGGLLADHPVRRLHAVLPDQSDQRRGRLAIIALSASGAIFLILELNHPFSGMMQISSAPRS